MLGRRFAVPGHRVAYERVELEELSTRVGSDVAAVPDHAGVVAWDARARRWLLHLGPRAEVAYRLPATMRFLDRRVRPRLPDRTFWSVLCLWDGWGEEAAPPVGAGPVSASQDHVLCFAARRGDAQAVLLPEVHYLERFHYARFRWEARRRRAEPTGWERTERRAIFCGGAHGRRLTPGGPTVRDLLAEVVARERLDVEVHLGHGVPRRRQRGHRYLLDVDGYVRTFDAWAWKLLSGRVVLSQASPWETFFTTQLEPWVHYVPVAEDFSDLGERIEWCRENDDECRAIARRAAVRALEVYDPRAATLRTVDAMRASIIR